MQSEHPTPENLLPDIGKDLEQSRKFVASSIISRSRSTSGSARARVKETPQLSSCYDVVRLDGARATFEEERARLYYYLLRPGQRMAGSTEKEEWLTAFNYYAADIVSIHEVYPGHYVQFLRLNASPATKVEKIFGSYAFIEGWAHYCEKMMIDQGYVSTPSSSPTPKPRASSSPTATRRNRSRAQIWPRPLVPKTSNAPGNTAWRRPMKRCFAYAACAQQSKCTRRT